MALADCMIWRGKYIATYQDELDRWRDSSDDINNILVRCEEVDPYDTESTMYDDSGGWLSGLTLILLGVQEWNADQVKFCLKTLDAMDIDVRLSMVYRSGEPTKAAMDAATTVNDRIIYFDADEMTKWGLKWLRDRGILVSKSAMSQVVEKVGDYDVEILVDAVTSLANGYQGRIDDADFVNRVTRLGATDAYNLTRAIAQGDRAQASEIRERLSGEDPFKLIGMLANRFRQYMIFSVDKNADLSESFHLSSGAAYYTSSEAQRLGRKNAVKALDLISTASQGLRGGSSMDNDTILMILVDQLTTLFDNN